MAGVALGVIRLAGSAGFSSCQLPADFSIYHWNVERVTGNQLETRNAIDYGVRKILIGQKTRKK
jgi:hypothetical protein